MRWAVVGTMDEAPEVVAAWAAWHLSQGAAELHIYLDRDNPRTRALLAQLPNVFVTVADRVFYRTVFETKRPRNHQFRQTRNATHAYQHCTADFLLHMDADEYLVQNTPLVEELKSLRYGFYLAIPNVERIYLPEDPPGALFTSHFRVSPRNDKTLPSPPTDEEGITRGGLVGHAEGKSISPTGQELILGLHRPRFETPIRARARPPMRRATSSVIAHFEGLTPLDWIQKRLRKAKFLQENPNHPTADHIHVQVAAVQKADRTRAGLFDVHDRLKCAAHMPGDGSIIKLDLDIEGTLERSFPEERLDLSAAMFDAWLKREKAAFFEEFEVLM